MTVWSSNFPPKHVPHASKLAFILAIDRHNNSGLSFVATFRRRYAEFLRIDFPRIPFCDTKAQFDELSKLGEGLVNAHLLRKQKRGLLAVYHGKGEHVVEAVRYSPEEQAIHISKTCHFAPVRRRCGITTSAVMR